MSLRATFAAGAAALSLLAVPTAAEARAIPWGGAGFNDLGSSYGLLSVSNGRVQIKNVQLIMACTDVTDRSESDRAFEARFLNWTPLRRNRFSVRFSALSGGRLGDVRVNGILRSNGTGAMRVEVDAYARGEGGELVERCQAATRIVLRRPRR